MYLTFYHDVLSHHKKRGTSHALRYKAPTAPLGSVGQTIGLEGWVWTNMNELRSGRTVTILGMYY